MKNRQAFMGASPIYEMFCGSMEITAGLLLLFRKTSTLGALWAAAVMLNIVMMNFCFDVPVKLYSSHLFLMMLFLLIPDMRPLWHFFVLRRISKLESVWIPRFGRRWLRATAIVIQVLVIGSILFQNLRGGYEGIKTGKEAGFQSLPLYGIWDVDSAKEVSANGASLDKDIQWRRLLVDHNWGVSGVSVRTSDDRLLRFIMNP